MTHLMLQYRDEQTEGGCAVCGKTTRLKPGLQLCAQETEAPVCSACGSRAAPALAALQGLAGTARRVGHINRHMVTPPLTALLELARAAESFSCCACPTA